jgi:sortase (surface protein transpeptidase)
MKTVGRNFQFHSHLTPTTNPVQIWPEPLPTQTFASAYKTLLDHKKKMEKINEPTSGKVLQKFYRYFIVFAIVSAILSNAYFIYVQLAHQNTTANAVSDSYSDNLFKPIFNTNILNNPPRRLIIPGINVDALVQVIGQTPEGAMDVPDNTSDVGWYKFGPVPGQKGNAIMDAHVDSPDGSPAVFSLLYTLKEGDSIIVEDDKNNPIYFTVEKVTSYPAEDLASDILNKTDGTYLSLITCNGFWDMAKSTYAQRLVVLAKAAQQ